MFILQKKMILIFGENIFIHQITFIFYGMDGYKKTVRISLIKHVS
jgi:hypothetical protein